VSSAAFPRLCLQGPTRRLRNRAGRGGARPSMRCSLGSAAWIRSARLGRPPCRPLPSLPRQAEGALKVLFGLRGHPYTAPRAARPVAAGDVRGRPAEPGARQIRRRARAGRERGGGGWGLLRQLAGSRAGVVRRPPPLLRRSAPLRRHGHPSQARAAGGQGEEDRGGGEHR